MIEAGLLVVLGCALGLFMWGVLGIVIGDSRDSRRYNRARKHTDRTRHVRTLEQELGLEPYPLGPLDAPDVPTASPVRHDTVAREQHATLAEAYRAHVLREIWRDD